jgi:glycosyltransferase involved in cell wall biosynthesis
MHDSLKNELDALQKELDSLHRQLIEKDQLIKRLGAEAEEKLQAIKLIDSELSRITHQSESDMPRPPEPFPDNPQISSTIRQNLEKLGWEREIHRRELLAKEEVIQSLVSYQRVSIRYLIENTFEAVKRVSPPMLFKPAELARNILRPSLGKLYQYDPKPLRLDYRRALWGSRRSPLPMISIVTPSFNQAGFLSETIESVLQQHYASLEYFIQDGGSTDGTAGILARYQRQVSGVESAIDGGQANAINRAFQRTSGEIMAWLNADDILLPGTLGCISDYFQKHPQTDVVYGDRILIDEQSREIGRWVLPSHEEDAFRWVDYVPQETLFWRRRIWEKVGQSLDESFHFAMDWDLILRFWKAGARFVHLPRFLGAFRVHSKQKTTQEMTSRGFEEIYRLRTRCHGRHVSNAEAVFHTYGYLRKHVVARWLRRLRIHPMHIRT